MDETKYDDLDNLAVAFEESRSRLRHIALMKMQPKLLQLIGVDDILQETWIAVGQRLEHFQKAKNIPVFVRFRTMLLQTIIDMERKYIVCQKRDIGNATSFDKSDSDQTDAQ